MSWTPSRVADLKRLWTAGYSASQCAHRLGGFTHCTDGGRSAVIGKAHRLGLAGRVTTTRTKSPARKRKIARENTKPPKVNPWAFGPPRRLRTDGLPLPVPGEADVPRVATVDLEERHCRFPAVHDVRDLPSDAPIFCGADRVPGLPYCATHVARCYGQPNARQRQSFTPRVVEKTEAEKAENELQVA